MLFRTLLTIVNVGVFAVAIAFDFLVPGVASWIFYALLAWFFASLFVFRLPVMSRPIGRAVGTAPRGTVPSTAPLPSSPANTNLGFCVYCAAPIEPGTPVCPSCGRTIPQF